MPSGRWLPLRASEEIQDPFPLSLKKHARGNRLIWLTNQKYAPVLLPPPRNIKEQIISDLCPSRTICILDL